MKLPTGKGMFIWMLDRTGTPAQAAEGAKKAGFSWVAIKLQNGLLVSDGNRNEQEFAALAPAYRYAFERAGIEVWGWGYVYGGQNSVNEARVTVQAARNYQVAGWLIDAEQEYKDSPVRHDAAVRYCNGVKGTLPSMPLGLCSYRFPSYHREFPWTEFCSRVDFHAPQVYWLQASNPGAQLRRSVQELTDIRNLPVVPAGCAYPFQSWRPSVGQMDEFHKTVEDLKLPGWLWWEWYYAVQNPEWWAAISRHGIPMGPSLEERVAKLEQAVEELQRAH